MSSDPHTNWGDDWMALADAVGATAPEHPELNYPFVAHPSYAEEFTNLALELLLNQWIAEVADQPIPLVPTGHDRCGGCNATLCGCEDSCRDLDGDACGHRSWPLCPDCAPELCRDCAETERRRDQ